MINNDVLRSLRHTISATDGELVKIFKKGEVTVAREDVWAFTKKEDDEEFRLLPDDQLSGFLDGLIEHRRGKNPNTNAPKPPLATTNNDVLKKIRIAFALTDVDMAELLVISGKAFSKSEINALFRSPGHKNFKLCGDQILRNFLASLARRERPETE